MGALRKAVWWVAAPLVVVAAGVGTLWLWSDADTSLATTLALAQRTLPTGQRLEASQVTGSLRQGGTIGLLRWQQTGLTVEAQDVVLTWSWRALLDGAWKIERLRIGHLRIDDQRPATQEPLVPPPDDLRLPVQVDAQWSVDQFQWTGRTTFTASTLTGRYVFDSDKHRIIAGRGLISSGIYGFAADLEALAPLRLTAQLDGTVQTTLRGRKEPVEVAAHANVTGTLAGPDATLEVQAALIPPATAKPRKNTSPSAAQHKSVSQVMQAQGSARVQPWKLQPVVQAQAQWQALDLAALWSQAPQTRLSGEAAVIPEGDGWKTSLRIHNALVGPWNLQRLPVEQLDASLVYALRRWSIQSLQARVAQGSMEAQAQTSPTDVGWIGQATVLGLNPAALDTRLAVASLDGELSAEQAEGGVRFHALLHAAKAPATRPPQGVTPPGKVGLPGLQLQSLEAQGQWKSPTLQLDTLALQTDDAQFTGKLTVNTADQSTQGEGTLRLPGTEGTARFQMAKTQGDGELRLQTTDAGLTHRWLARLPGASRDMAGAKVTGEATLEALWTGGWQNDGQAVAVQAKLRAARLDWTDAGAPDSSTWRLRNAQLDLAGTPSALVLTSQTQAERGTQRLSVEARGQGARQDEGAWTAQLNSLALTLQDTRRTGVWTMRLADSVTWLYQQSGSRKTLEGSPGSLRLTGPVPGTAVVAWQSTRWSQTDLAGQPRIQWSTQGSFSDLPMNWLEPFSPTPWSDLGLRGDVVLGGEWEALSSDSLRLRARVERTRGDLQIRPDDDAPPVRAGIKLAKLEVSTVDDQVNATLRWDSERAGQAQADFSTRLQRQDNGWTWPQDAALVGQFKAQLPPVGAWSVLAPPGWRLRGTLDADATLSGTRSRPLWRGQLSAKDLAMRSVVDGIDFSGGTLRARLEGERLEIEEVSFQGAGGATGGLLTAQGFVQWQGGTAMDNNTLGRLRMELNATAKSLRVSARSDRRLVLSGKLSSKLEAAKLIIRGNLTADQALFVMPEDTTPRLGDDVVVRKAPAAQKAPAIGAPPIAAVLPAATTANGPRIQPDVLVTLDLGQDFQVRGAGLVTLLEGSVELRQSQRNQQPRLTGTLRTAQGTYKAYGQQLDIEEGVLRFTGPYDNPSLDILAIRPNLTQRVGVQISGTAQYPLVRLYAEPDLPDSEKLSWLILGRSGANGGAEAALLQQAALALLGSRSGSGSGNIADAFGLDELSLRGGSNGDGINALGNGASTGSTAATGATGATVTLGKRLSRDFYVAYERSLAGTVGTLSIFYDLSRRFTLRAQTGEQSAVDLIFTLRYD